MAAILQIDDLHDPRLAAYQNLREHPVNDPGSDDFVVEGRLCLQHLAASQCEIRSVLIERGRESLVDELDLARAPVYSLPKDQMRTLVGFNFHRGLLACGNRPDVHPVDQLRLGGNRPSLALAVLGVQLHDNLGSIMRSAAALGVRDVLIGPGTADPYCRRTIRVSMSAVLQQTLYALDKPQEQLSYLARQRGYRTVVTTLRQAVPLEQFVRDERPIVLIVGSEADGVDPAVESVGTDRVTIPMQPGTDSLNVAVATAIFLYELAK